MPIPTSIQVKISSEAVESIAITPVVVQEMRFGELVQQIVSGTGKDLERVREVLHRGSFVRGGSRFRWHGIELTAAEVADLLQAFPDPDPERRFDPSRCAFVQFRGVHSSIRVDRAPAQRRRLFRRRSFWDELLTLTSDLSYAGYSYGDHADIYRTPVTADRYRWLRDAARLSPYGAISQQIEAASLVAIEFFVSR